MTASSPGPVPRAAERPLRVLLVTTSMSGGGAERQVYLLARGLRHRGHTVAVVSMVHPEHYAAELAELDVELTSLGMTGGVPDPGGLWRLARYVRRWRPDVVHSHMVHANLLARLARLLAPMPVQISTAHNISEGARWRELAYRVTDPLCTLSTNVCGACVERFVAVGAAPRRKMIFVPNGLDLRGFAPDDGARQELRCDLGVEEAFVWLAVGRFDAQKDYPTMLQAVRRVPKVRPFVVVVAGRGPEREAIEALAAELGLDGAQLRFLGHRRDIPDLMRAADGFLMSSAWEGLPMVLLEAGASRLPAVATDVGGNREVIEPEATGLLVPPRDPDALAEAMGRVMAMPREALESWGLAARRHVEETFEIGHVVERWEALYRELLDRPAGRVAEGGRP